MRSVQVTTPDPMLTTNQVAEWLGIHPKSVARMRMEGRGPVYKKIGVHVRYLQSDVQDWINNGAVG